MTCFVTFICVAKLYIMTFSTVSYPALGFSSFWKKGTWVRLATPQCFPELLGFGRTAGCSYFQVTQICLSLAGISFSSSTMVFNPTRLSISDLPQMPETVLKTCSKDFSQIPLFIQLFLLLDQLYWLGCHYRNHHTKFLLTLIKMHVLSMTKSVHFPCLCVQTASYIHTFLFLLNLLPQTEFIFCLAFYVRNTHHVI